MSQAVESAILVRAATKADGSRLEEIEQSCFTDCPWDAASILHDECWVAETNGTVAAFLVSREIVPGDSALPGEREILNLAVHPAWRRRGLAKALLERELSRPAIFFLEVRESNLAARSLYIRLGFEEIGKRSDYYQNPAESAIVMKRK
jgi:ribosomal-protein-alanine N-acetyltransferase